jgi:hypothetical protein
MSELPKSSIGNSIKLYIFPSLVTILAMLIWRDVSELRSDVKSLLAQSNVDKTEILNLKKDVQMIQSQLFKPVATSHAISDNFLIAYRDKYFKHEEVFDINKYIPKTD